MPDQELDQNQIIANVRDALKCESEAIAAAVERVDHRIAQAVQILFDCSGRLIITGMGKMGLIGRKAAATFSSTGAPAIFLHPVDALHGDLGVVTDDDVVIALSQSGATEEVITLMSYMHRRGVPVIALTGKLNSTLAATSSVVIDTSVDREADPIAVAPTASSTLALAMCDALAIALMHARGFSSEQFAEFHPGGSLGRKLLTNVDELMKSDGKVPIVTCETRLQEAIVEISQKGLGCVFVCDDENELKGILTDGDLRRVFETANNPLSQPISDFMTGNPRSIGPNSLAVEALHLMEQHSITVLPVVNQSNMVVGAIHLHDLLAAGLA